MFTERSCCNTTAVLRGQCDTNGAAIQWFPGWSFPHMQDGCQLTFAQEKRGMNLRVATLSEKFQFQLRIGLDTSSKYIPLCCGLRQIF